MTRRYTFNTLAALSLLLLAATLGFWVDGLSTARDLQLSSIWLESADGVVALGYATEQMLPAEEEIECDEACIEALNALSRDRRP